MGPFFLFRGTQACKHIWYDYGMEKRTDTTNAVGYEKWIGMHERFTLIWRSGAYACAYAYAFFGLLDRYTYTRMTVTRGLERIMCGF
jgi:hypothetical protein